MAANDPRSDERRQIMALSESCLRSYSSDDVAWFPAPILLRLFISRSRTCFTPRVSLARADRERHARVEARPLRASQATDAPDPITDAQIFDAEGTRSSASLPLYITELAKRPRCARSSPRAPREVPSEQCSTAQCAPREVPPEKFSPTQCVSLAQCALVPSTSLVMVLTEASGLTLTSDEAVLFTTYTLLIGTLTALERRRAASFDKHAVPILAAADAQGAHRPAAANSSCLALLARPSLPAPPSDRAAAPRGPPARASFLPPVPLQRTSRWDAQRVGITEPHRRLAGARVGASAVAYAARLTVGGCAFEPQTLLAADAAHKRRPSILPRGAVFDTPGEKRQAKKEVLAQELVARLTPAMAQHLLGAQGYRQVRGTADRAAALARIVLALGGPDGDGLAAAAKALEALSAHAIRIHDPDPHCLPVSALLAHTLVAQEYAAGLANGAGRSLGGASRGDAFRGGLVWLRDHLRIPIDLDPLVVDSAAPKAKDIPGAGRVKAGTFPIQVVCQFEHVAMGVSFGRRRSIVLTHFARSILVFGIFGSLRVQDMEEITSVMLDDFAPDQVARAKVRVSKNGEPLEVFAPAEGILGPLAWYAEHRDACVRLGAFPRYLRPHGSHGELAASPGWVGHGLADGDTIRAAIREIASLAPLSLSQAQVAALSLRGHSSHGTFNDYMKALGQWIELFPPGYELGFSKADRDASGHWLSFSSTDADATPAPPPKQAAGKAKAVAAQGCESSLMRERYGRGDGRCGERTEQLKIRLRLILVLRRLLARWSAHWGVSWMRLPAGHASKLLLSQPPESLRPSTEGF